MPEYLAPGVFVEETSFRAKSIEGVGTSTAAFVGLTARGPMANSNTDPMPPLITSFVDFERIYGGTDDLRIGGNPVPNYLAHSARAFFANGGGRLYVARVPGTGAEPGKADVNDDGTASKKAVLTARTAGGSEIAGMTGVNFLVHFRIDELATTKKLARKQVTGTMVKAGSGTEFAGIDAIADTDTAAFIQSVSVEVYDPTGLIYEASGLGLHKRHPRYIGTVMGPNPPQTRDALTNPVQLAVGSTMTEADLLAALTGTGGPKVVQVKGGSDGSGGPGSSAYATALDRLLALEDISIVAAPGLSSFADIAADVNQKLIGHAEKTRAYRIAVLDAPPNNEPGDVTAIKSKIDSKYAALYYPWVRVANPLAGTDPTQPTELDLPPSGHVCGIYARTDIQRGVWKAPANETVTGALGVQRAISFGEQEKLNPLGINCIRALPNRGIRVWGARTISSDPEWKYVNIRRYFLYLESSIDRGTQWAVFEPNGEALWANVRTTISDFLYNEWVNGALLGTTPKEAFFVRCDRTTMTQNDLDNGRLICLIGVAAIKPAEFVIFRIGQKTADSRG
jgi:uncharacterized protein